MASAAGSRCATPRSASSLALAAYFGFARALGVNIGAGFIETSEPAHAMAVRLSHGHPRPTLRTASRSRCTPVNLLWCLVGMTLGTAIGVLPGIGPALTIALLLPITSRSTPTAAFIMFAGIYYGAMYGGSTTSILLNTPGESASIVTALEGNMMARTGRAGAGAGHGGDRLVRRRHHRHARRHLPGADRGRARAAVRAGRVFRADGAGLHHGVARCSAPRRCAA